MNRETIKRLNDSQEDDQRFITRQTDLYTFELDRADLSLCISTAGRQFRLNATDVAAMIDLLQ